VEKIAQSNQGATELWKTHSERRVYPSAIARRGTTKQSGVLDRRARSEIATTKNVSDTAKPGHDETSR